MTDFIRERAKLIVSVALLITMIVLVRSMTHSPTSDPTGQSDVVAARHQAEDVGAQTVLQQASIAMETVFAQTGTFADGAAAAAAVEPNITWTAGGEGDAASNVVGVVADASTYTLSARSPSGTVYTYARSATGTVTKACGPDCAW